MKKFISYSEKLKNPKWQKKRLEILERDLWSCQGCYDTKSTLHVHHCYYKSGLDPWKYSNESLVTLCESCHKKESQSDGTKEQLLIDNLKKKGFMSGDFEQLAEAAGKFKFTHVRDVVLSAISEIFTNTVRQRKVIDDYLNSKVRKNVNTKKRNS